MIESRYIRSYNQVFRIAHVFIYFFFPDLHFYQLQNQDIYTPECIIIIIFYT